jgi:outer membrane protein, multidrug efflux system
VRASRIGNSLGISALLLALLAGCAVGPNYKRPGANVPPAFRGAAAQTNSLAELPWWEVFGDPDLQRLIATALTNNFDVRIAAARIEQAQAVWAENRAGLLPQLNYGGSIGRGKNAAGSNPVFTGRSADTFAVAANAAWEVDLWGRIRRLSEAARAEFFASREARRDLQLSLISQVGQAYFRLLALDQQLEIARRSTNSFHESLRIFSQRLQEGVVSKLETSAAEAALASAAATVPELERQVFIQENLVNVLAGRNPGPVPRNHKLLEQKLPPAIPPGLPSDLLRRRSDIAQAEELFRAANAQVGVAVADFFPKLSLSGMLGQVSPELSLFTSGAANAWSVGADAAGPIFQGGRLRAQYRQALAAREEARLRYQSTVLNSLQEVSNALISAQKLAEARVQQERAVNAFQVAVQVATQRYVAGRAGYFELLQEQQQLFPSENNLVQTELNQYLAIVQLYRALGGGFGDPPK